jgi:predicted amidohydrolase YtcJ
MQKRILTAFGLAVIASGTAHAESVTRPADTIFLNGEVITVNRDNIVTDAVAVTDGRIVALGNDVSDYRGDLTKVIDLEGRTLLPGFIDSHSHVTIVAVKQGTVDLSPPPAGAITELADIERQLTQRIATRDLDDDVWVVGWGYDHSMLKENRHPTREDLDKISTEHPIVLIHFSGHQAVLNSKGLARIGYGADTPDPPGGVIQRISGSREPNGIIEEQAWIPVWMEILNMPFEQRVANTAEVINRYAAEGFTTVQDGGTVDPEVVRLFAELDARKQLPVDVIAFPFDPSFAQFDASFDQYREYQNRFRFGGAKLVLDGGSPGRTAYLREPYHVQMEGEQEYRGYPHTKDQAVVDARVAYYYSRDIPLNIHALGDAAVDQAIHAIERAEQKWPDVERRTNLIHLQMLQEDQLDRLQTLDVTLTFQVAHNFYFGDLHRTWTFGPERAARLNPVRSAADRGIPYTIHHDAPIHPVDQLMLIWAAVNRVTRSGEVLGPEQRISVMDAIRASTINAAFQYFEEDHKGSIEVGKLADFVLLSENPLTIDSLEIKDIQIVATFKEGRPIYQRAGEGSE